MFPQKLTNSYVQSSLIRKIYHQITSRAEQRLLGSRQAALASYTVVTANSAYTAGWVKRYWRRDATVVYPVCDDMGPPASKKKSILNVGRFFADNGSSHHKKQHELIKAFIKLNRSDWELHLAGSVAADADSQQYMSQLKDLAKGHPGIRIHPNAPMADLRQLYQEAALYWHATGLGYDPEAFPENQEHFGISTVEAMSAGAVPVVIKSAGQLEIVQTGVNGFLWTSIDELLAKSKPLLDDPKLRQKISKQAVLRAKQFDRQSFLKRIDQIILGVTHG